MKWVIPDIVVDQNIKIAKIEKSDIDYLFEVYSDSEVLKYTDENVFLDKSYMELFFDSVKRGYENYEYCELKIEYKMKAVGTVSFHSINEEKKECEIGFLLARKYWGNGIMSKVINALVRYLNNEMKIEKIIADIESKNQKAIKLVEKNGFKHIKGTYYELIANA